MSTRFKLAKITEDATLNIAAGKTLDVSGADVSTVGSGTAEITFPSTDGTLAKTTDIPVSGTDFDPVGTDNSDDNAINTLYSGLEASKEDALGFTPENIANKENTTIDTSTTKYPTVNLLKTGLDAKAPSLGADDNYVTDAEKIVIENTSGTNTGDQDIPVSGTDFDPVGTDNSDDNAINTLYSGLEASKQDTITSGTADPTGGSDGDIYFKYV